MPRTCANDARSPTTTSCAVGTRARAVAARASLRACSVTAWPCSASWRAVTWPMPSADPVTRTRAMTHRPTRSPPGRGHCVDPCRTKSELLGRSDDRSGVPERLDDLRVAGRGHLAVGGFVEVVGEKPPGLLGG